MLISAGDTGMRLSLVQPRATTLWYYDLTTDSIVSDRYTQPEGSSTIAVANAIVVNAGLVGVAGATITRADSLLKDDIIGRIDPL